MEKKNKNKGGYDALIRDAENICNKSIEDFKNEYKELFESKSNLEVTMKITFKGLPTLMAIMEEDKVKTVLTEQMKALDFGGHFCDRKLTVKVKPYSEKKKGDIK